MSMDKMDILYSSYMASLCLGLGTVSQNVMIPSITF